MVVHKDSPDERGIDVTLLVSKGKPMCWKRTGWAWTWARTARDILHAALLWARKDTIQVFVNHWPSRLGEGGGERVEADDSGERLRHAVDGLLAKDRRQRIIIMGVPNDEPLDASLKERPAHG